MGTLRDCLLSLQSSVSYPLNCLGLITTVGRTALARARCRARVPTASLWAWGSAPTTWNSLTASVCRASEGRVVRNSHVFAVAQHGVPPERRSLPGAQHHRAAAVDAEERPRPHPTLICRKAGLSQSGHTGCAAFTPEVWAGQVCIAFIQDTQKHSLQEAATALPVGLQ